MIRVDERDGFSIVTIDRPERANALDTEHCTGIHTAVDHAVDAGQRCMVITGVGGVFSAGADLRDGVGAQGFNEAHYGMLHALVDAPIPVIAAVNGHAIGAGMQLAISCDLRVAASEATFAIPTARLGLAVDPWTIERLVNLVGAGPAQRVLMTCDRVAASDPAIAGLVDRSGDIDTAVELAADIATMAPLTLRYIKLAVRAAHDPGTHDAAQSAFDAIWESADAREGVRARRDRRPPEFRGL